jgi:hypothetical protein
MLGGAETDGAGSREAFVAHYHLRGFFCCLPSLVPEAAKRQPCFPTTPQGTNIS